MIGFIRWLLRRGDYCLWPWQHEWNINRNITVPLWDCWSKGELWRCRNCPAVKAK